MDRAGIAPEAASHHRDTHPRSPHRLDPRALVEAEPRCHTVTSTGRMLVVRPAIMADHLHPPVESAVPRRLDYKPSPVLLQHEET